MPPPDCIRTRPTGAARSWRPLETGTGQEGALQCVALFGLGLLKAEWACSTALNHSTSKQLGSSAAIC